MVRHIRKLSKTHANLREDLNKLVKEHRAIWRQIAAIKTKEEPSNEDLDKMEELRAELSGVRESMLAIFGELVVVVGNNLKMAITNTRHVVI